jgi:hypothetical protein
MLNSLLFLSNIFLYIQHKQQMSKRKLDVNVQFNEREIEQQKQKHARTVPVAPRKQIVTIGSLMDLDNQLRKTYGIDLNNIHSVIYPQNWINDNQTLYIGIDGIKVDKYVDYAVWTCIQPLFPASNVIDRRHVFEIKGCVYVQCITKEIYRIVEYFCRHIKQNNHLIPMLTGFNFTRWTDIDFQSMIKKHVPPILPVKDSVNLTSPTKEVIVYNRQFNPQDIKNVFRDRVYELTIKKGFLHLKFQTIEDAQQVFQMNHYIWKGQQILLSYASK